MKNQFVQYAVSFKPGIAADGRASIPTQTVASTEQQLSEALARIQALELRLEKLEAALSPDPNGDVHLFAPGRLLIQASNAVEITGTQNVRLADSHGNSFKLSGSGVETHSAAKAAVHCSQHEVTAATSNCTAATAQFTGVVKCVTLTADVVSGASYTPGAGNVW